MAHNKPSGLAISLLLASFGISLLYLYLPDKQFIYIMDLMEVEVEQVLEHGLLLTLLTFTCTIGGVRLYYDLRYGETYMDTVNLRGRTCKINQINQSRVSVFLSSSQFHVYYLPYY